MGESICRFIPKKKYENDLKVIHFVYETEHSRLKQPFLRPFYYIYLITEGNAKLTISGREYDLCVGDIVLTVPGATYRMDGSENFRYLYLSFAGSCVRDFLTELKVEPSDVVFHGYERITEFWFSAISRVTPSKASYISESVILYTLSLLGEDEDSATKRTTDSSRFEMILNYVNENYRDPSLTLCKVADIFSYSEKYVSSLFKKHMEMGFNRYINSRRINYALRLIDKGEKSVKEISLSCGFCDALYFSKVFKKVTGTTPTEMIKKK